MLEAPGGSSVTFSRVTGMAQVDSLSLTEEPFGSVSITTSFKQ
jgi:hypothetical protein